MSDWTEADLQERYRNNPDLARANAYVSANAPLIIAERHERASEAHKKRAHPHDDFVQQIVQAAHLYGWRAVYWRAARTAKGWATPVGGDGNHFPDLFLCKPHYCNGKWTHSRLLHWEVKIPPDKVRPGQQEWLDILGGRVVTPDDWQYIEATLRG